MFLPSVCDHSAATFASAGAECSILRCLATNPARRLMLPRLPTATPLAQAPSCPPCEPSTLALCLLGCWRMLKLASAHQPESPPPAGRCRAPAAVPADPRCNKAPGDANGHFTTVLRGALCAFSSRAAAARPADEQAAAGASSGSAAAADEGSSSGSSVGQADAPCLEQCRAELQALAAAHDASGKAIAQTLRRCHGQYDDASLAEVRAAEQQAQQRTERAFSVLERLCASPAGSDGGGLEGTAGAVGAAAAEGEGGGAGDSAAGAGGHSSRPTLAELAQEEPPQQKQMLGECLFPRVEALQVR